MSESRFRIHPGKGLPPIEFSMQPGQRLLLGHQPAGPEEQLLAAASTLNRISIPAATVSYEHVITEMDQDGACQVTDAGSRNGTWARLAERQSQRLQPGDSVYLGRDVKLEYLAEPPPGSKQAPLPESSAMNRSAAARSAVELLERLQQAQAHFAHLYFYAPDSPEKGAPDRVFPLAGEGRAIALKWRSHTRLEQVEQDVAEQINLYNIQQQAQPASLGDFAAGAPARRRVIEFAARAAPTGLSLLIMGPHGSGKDVLARDIHNLSHRTGPFVAVNCAGLSEHLAMSELFGHTRGSFSGAYQSHTGLFGAAHGGTLFLDEIGDMPLPVQAVLLRALETGTVRKVGSIVEEPVDVRIIAATHRDIDERVRANLFREDLLFRLAECRLFVPSLESADILELAPQLLRELQGKLFGKQPAPGTSGPPGAPYGPLSKQDEQRVVELAAVQSWSGSVRELRNALKRLLLMRKPGQSIDEAWQELLALGRTPPARPVQGSLPASAPEPHRASLSAGPKAMDKAEERGAALEGSVFKLDDICTHVGRVAFLTELEAALASSRRAEYQAVAKQLGIMPPAVWGRLQRLKLVAQAGDRVSQSSVQKMLKESRDALFPHMDRLLRYIRGSQPC
jgi:DNA-binding NtrC family response regulator